MGVMAAFIFAAQMFNFQVAGGTSGHLLGGVLAAVLLGPWAGTLVMACVIAVQALVFSDGGLVVMGANIFNMGIVGTLGGFALYLVLCRRAGRRGPRAHPRLGDRRLGVGRRGRGVHVARARRVRDQPGRARPARRCSGVHAFIGIGEALITAAALAFIAATRQDLLDLRPDRAAALARRTAGPAWRATGAASPTASLEP